MNLQSRLSQNTSIIFGNAVHSLPNGNTLRSRSSRNLESPSLLIISDPSLSHHAFVRSWSTVLTRLMLHLNSTDALPHSMIGFRTGLSTHNVLLQLSREIITPPRLSPLHTAAILALDLIKAFDRVTHPAILHGVELISPGGCMYTYVRNFLTSRTAFIQIGDLQSDTLTLPSVGTPQGAVLSPMLFNLAVLNIPKKLETIPPAPSL